MTRDPGVRFERVELRYGRHAAAFDLVSGPGATANGGSRGPFVILGPNGAGKSTLVEALLRTLFGFRRLKSAERETHDLRRPWRGGGYHGRVRIGTPDGTYTFERDFDTDQVRVTHAGRESPEFEEEANPARDGESMTRYRALLERTVGLVELDAYLTTACVFQGELIATDLDLGLLRVAAGGHADIETARLKLEEEYRRLTVEPIADDASRRRKPGELERIAGEAGDLETRLREARAAEARRLPLVRSRDELRGRIESLESEVERLSDAFVTLSEAERLHLEAEASRGRIRGLETATRDLDEALARLDLLADRGEMDRRARYPEDFETRARLLEEELWPDAADIEEELARLRAPRADALAPVRHPGGLAGAVVVTAGGAALGLTGRWAGTVIAALGVLGMAAWWIAVRVERARATEAERRIDELERRAAAKRERIERLCEGIPDGHGLGPESLSAHRREFAREREELALRTDAERRLRQTMDSARRALETVDEPDAGEGGSGGEATEPEGSGSPGDVRTRARDLLERLRDRVARERDDVMAPLKFRLGELARSRFELPTDVDASLESVRRARRERLEGSETLRAELGEVERELALEGRHGESALSIERELAATRDRARALSDRAEAYRRAHGLIADAYEAFRRTDEQRLLDAISGHLVELSGGALGPLEVEGGLESAVVTVGERTLPIASPPLSYGQLHAALLAIRLGAADFLAGLGVRIPLLIDDPFVHLDERSAADLWRVLGRVARERQVIIATQDRLVLDHLGIAADLELAGPRVSSTGGPATEPSPRVPTGSREAADEDGPAGGEEPGNGDAGRPLDLWSQADA